MHWPLVRRAIFTTAAFAALVLTARHAAAQDAFAGEWRGYWTRAGDTLPVTLHVKRDAATGAYAANFDADRLRVMGIPFTEVKLEGCCAVTMRLVGDRTTTTFTGALRGSVLAGDLSESDGPGMFSYTRVAASVAGPVEKEVTFRNGDVTLAGTLLLPAGTGRHAAVVFVHGSGAEGRWASRFLAAKAAERGIAALIFDKRGVGASTGDWRTAHLDDLAGDAIAAVERLLEEPRVDATRIGIHGHSQGGTLAPMIAARSKRVAFVIGSAAAGMPTDSTEIFSILNSLYPRASTAADSANARTYVAELVDVAYHPRSHARLDSLAGVFQGQPWYLAPPAAGGSYWSFSAEFAKYQPLDWWRRVRVPVLLVYGAADQRVPAAESAARISDAIIRSTPGADVTVRLFPNADHTFRLPPGPSRWPRSAPDHVPALLDWLARR